MKPKKKDIMKFAPLDNFPTGYNLAYDEWEQHIKLKLDIDVLSSIIHHVMTEEGVLDFCEKDCNAIAKAIKLEVFPKECI